MQETDVIWILSDVNIVTYIKTAITGFSLMLISSEAEKHTTEVDLMLTSSDTEKPELLKFLWFLYDQMQNKIYYWSFSDLNIIRCWKTGIIELCLMLTSSDAVKRDIMEFCLLISSDTENRSHWIFSDVNIIRCRKTDIIEFCLRFISSDVEKHISLMFVSC